MTKTYCRNLKPFHRLSKNQTINDIKKLALDISIKSIKDLLNKQKEIKDGQLIGKSITNLFYKSKKEQKNYNNL